MVAETDIDDVELLELIAEAERSCVSLTSLIGPRRLAKSGPPIISITRPHLFTAYVLALAGLTPSKEVR